MVNSLEGRGPIVSRTFNENTGYKTWHERRLDREDEPQT
jgi:hypothetical protein